MGLGMGMDLVACVPCVVCGVCNACDADADAVSEERRGDGKMARFTLHTSSAEQNFESTAFVLVTKRDREREAHGFGKIRFYYYYYCFHLLPELI